MKLFLVGFLLCICATTSAREIVATGHGATKSSALQNAKREAVDQVAGTFFMIQTDIEGGGVTERISEYSGGFIRSYEVISMDAQDGTVNIIIRADVDEDKINAVVFSDGLAVSETAITTLKNARNSHEELRGALGTVMEDRNKIHTKIKSVEYMINGLQTRVLIEFEAAWSPKWFSDLQSIASTSGPDLSVFTYKDYGVCFYGDRKLLLISVECYDIHSELDLPSEIAFTIRARTPDDGGINMGYVSLRSSALYYHRIDRVFGQELIMYKNGVLRGSATFDVDTKTLEQVSGFDIISSLNDSDAGYDHWR